MLLIVLKMKISVISRGIKQKRMCRLNLIIMVQCPVIRARLAVSCKMEIMDPNTNTNLRIQGCSK